MVLAHSLGGRGSRAREGFTMNQNRRPIRLLIAGSVLLLASCGSSGSDVGLESADSAANENTTTSGPTPIFSESEFSQVCRGTGLATASAYTPEGDLHPLVFLEGEDPEYSYSTVTLPDGWETSFESFETTQLVACLNRVSATPAELCEGYEDDDSDLSWSVQTFDSSYELTLRDAQSATVVAEQAFEGPSEGCPMLSFFTEGDPNPAPDYDVPSTEIEVFLKQYVTGA